MIIELPSKSQTKVFCCKQFYSGENNQTDWILTLGTSSKEERPFNF